MPWLLCRGDVAQNIADLRDGPVATEPLTLKIQLLARHGYRMAALVDGVNRLANCPFSTSAHEQGHGSAAIIHKNHPGYSTRLITARALLHICRCLYSPAPVSTLLKRTEAALARLESRRPFKTHGRQMFLKDLQAVMADHGSTSAAFSRAAMQQHAKLFKRFPLERHDKSKGKLRRMQRHSN